MLTPLQCIEEKGYSTILFEYSIELKLLLNKYADNIYYYRTPYEDSDYYFFIDNIDSFSLRASNLDNLAIGYLLDAAEALEFFSMYLPLYTLNKETQQLYPLEHFKTYITLWAETND